MLLRRVMLVIAAGTMVVGAGMVPAPADGCTSIMVGKKASTDGSVLTSHTCDSHRTGSAVTVVPAAHYSPEATLQLTRRGEDDTGPMPRYSRVPTGVIPQVTQTFAYLAPAYAAMNEHQLAIGESTFGGREELVSDQGLIDCETLTRLMLERARTAREAIRIGGELIERYGWLDEGEGLTIADPEEVWLMEIVGPGEGEVGAVWAARRVPDDHVSVIANSSRIGQVDLTRPDEFMASANLESLAAARGYWDPASGRPFRFYEAYDPTGNMSFAASRRIWRVFDLLAPSLKLHPNANILPFSVKPERPVGPETVMELLRDTYEGTPYDPVKDLTVTDKQGATVKSPLANPFMPYDMNRMLRINGGWGWRGERPIARWYCMYATVIQSRSWLPDPVGGVLWLGYSNPAMAVYVPLYAGITDLPSIFETDGRSTGFSHEAGWWAFNRVSTLAAHRWGEMRSDVAEVRDPMQQRLLDSQADVAAEAVRLLASDPEAALAYLTRLSAEAAEEATDAYWRLGDHLWTTYDEQW